jgi:membrane-associated phospholipid phosphatase
MKKSSFIFIIFSILFCQNAFAQNADINLLRNLNPNGDAAMDGFFKTMSYEPAVGAIAGGIPAGLLLWGLHKKDKALQNKGLQIGTAFVLNLGATLIIKNAVHRTRPYITYPDLNEKALESTASFPSGHTSVAFQTATSLTLNYPHWEVAVPAYLWASTVAYSRMHLGVHYPTDVLCGALLGAGSAWLTWKVNQKWRLQ